MKRKKGILTEKEKIFLGALRENKGNAGLAAKIAYDCKNDASARSLGHAKKERLKEKLGEDFFDSMGLTRELIVGALVADIKSNRGKRVPELTLGAKLRGDLVEKKEEKVVHSFESYMDYLEEEDEQPRASEETSE